MLKTEIIMILMMIILMMMQMLVTFQLLAKINSKLTIQKEVLQNARNAEK